MLTNAWVAIEVACLAALMAHLAIIVYNKEKQESTIADREFIFFCHNYDQTKKVHHGYASR